MEFQKHTIPAINIERLIKKRLVDQDKESEIIRDKSLIQQTLSTLRGKEASKDEVIETIQWLEKISKYVPIDTENELEEIIKVMVLLSQERAKFNELYDYPGLNLMQRVREGMIRYMVVLSEVRARQKEFLEYWYTDEYWITEWSQVLLNLPPESKMINYGFDNITARDFLHLLELELAAADDASKVEKPMVRLQPLKNKDTFLIIPTEAAAEEYKIQVDRIINGNITFTEWVKDTLGGLHLPK